MRTLPLAVLVLMVVLGIPASSRSQDVDLDELLKRLGDDAGEIGRALGRLKRGELDSFAIGPLAGEGDFLEGERAVAAGLHSGMSGIRVTSLFPRGLGARSGLRVGDVIVGAGARELAKDPAASRPLTDSTPYLTLTGEVEAARDEGCFAVLTVLREKETVVVEVPTPGETSHSEGCPPSCPRCAEIAELALERLAAMQQSTGAFPAGINGPDGQAVTTSVAGLAFLAAGSTPTKGRFATRLRRCRGWLRSQGSSASNWNLAFSTIFLARCMACSPDEKTRSALKANRAALLANQRPSGGWAHGEPDRSYGELNAVTVFCLAALGELRGAGLTVDAEPIARAIDYLDASSDGRGGVGYSARPNQKGFGWAGLTAGAVYALHRVRLPRHPFTKKAVKYLREHWDDLPHGHATTCYHFLAGALAARELEAGDRTEFRRRLRLHFLTAHNGDGTFGVPMSDVGTFGLSTDRLLGEAWRTAVFALVLAVG